MSLKLLFRSLLSAAALIVVAAEARAQQIPSPAQAQQMLQNDPTLIVRLQAAMVQSGKTPEQVREMLRAQGYPEAMLDQYLPLVASDTASATNPTATSPTSGDTASAAAGSDSSMAAAAAMRRRLSARQDSLFLDSLQRGLKDDSTRNAIRAVLSSRSMVRSQVDSGFRVFGLDLFSQGGSLFEANAAAVGADAGYRFGPTDQFTLFITGDVQKTYRLTVSREGFVVIPDVGQINVAGLTRAQLDDALYNQLGRVYSGVRRGGGTTRFYVDVGRVGANQVYVNGDVVQPGSYRVTRGGTVLNALYAAGGPTANGTLRNVQVRRGNQTVATLDFYDYALRGDASNDVRIENGDVVFVPTRGGQVRVAGRVLRPATYEIRSNETLADVLKMAGGFAETADQRRVQIERVVPANERTAVGSDRRIIDVPSDLFASAIVRGGDVVKVYEIAHRVANRVNVIGNVWTPGPLGLTQGMHLYDALRRAGGLKPDSYLGQILITRLRADSTRDMMRTAVFDTTGRPVNDIVLSDGDEIQVFSTTQFRPRRFITVNGAVRRPGQIAFREGMTMRDAVMLAGGVAEGALLTEAEIARLPENRAAGVTAITTRVPMDSSYLFERGANGRYSGPPGISVAAGTTPEVPLEPYDAILIKTQPEWQLQQTVTIAGEVRYPGAYSLEKKTDRLADIIQRAGGLTSSAYAGGIIFVRRAGAVGRIGIDLPSVLRDPHQADNLQLVDGDSIFIPRFSPVVTMRGAVNSLVGVAYVEGADIDYYIRSAGGETTKGDRKHAYVTQPNGKVQTKRSHVFGIFHVEPKPQPGSTVFVPDKDPGDKHDWAQIATATTSVLGSLVAIVALLRH